MTPLDRDLRPAFRTLGTRLAIRRLAALDPRMWVVLAVLVLCVGAFTYWQVRVPLDGTLRHAGPAVATGHLALWLAAFLLAGGALAASRQVALASDPPGPEWLALPIPPAVVERHLAREARLPALAVAPPAAAAWLAGWGLLSPAWLGVLAASFCVGLWFVARLACALALRASLRVGGPARRLPVAWRVLVSARRPLPRRRIASAAFQAKPRWRALAGLDRLVSLRSGSPRARLGFSLMFLALSLAAWFLGAEPLQLRAQAFAAFLVACAGLGAWAAWRAAGDPPALLRPLPLSLADAWRARALPLLLLIGGTLLAHTAVAAPMPGLARLGLAVTWLLPAVLVTLLGLHIGLSLSGTPVVAENLYYGWLGVGLVASLAIPLFGWGILIAALGHATRRLSRWNTPEVG